MTLSLEGRVIIIRNLGKGGGILTRETLKGGKRSFKGAGRGGIVSKKKMEGPSPCVERGLRVLPKLGRGIKKNIGGLRGGGGGGLQGVFLGGNT